MQILKQLQSPNLLLRLAVVVATAVLWFLPDICGAPYPYEYRDFKFLDHFVWFSLPAFWASFVQFWVILLIAIWLEVVCERRRILANRSAIPFTVMLPLVACINHLQFFSASTVAFALFLYSVSQLLRTYGAKKECVAEAFNIGVAMALAAMFDRLYVLLIPLIIIGTIVFGTISVRTLITFVVGQVLTVLLVVEIFLLSDMWPALQDALAVPLFADVTKIPMLAWSEWGLIGLLVLTTLVAVSSYVSASTIFNLNVRLNYVFDCIALVLTLVLALFTGWHDPRLLLPLLFATLIVAFYFTNTHTKFSNAVFIIFAVGCTACRILSLFGI